MAGRSLTTGDARPQQCIPCRRCGQEVKKRGTGQLYCGPCGSERRRQTRRECEDRRRREAGANVIGADFNCPGCGKATLRTGGHRKFCADCSKRRRLEKKRLQAEREAAEVRRARGRRYYAKNRDRLLSETKRRKETDPCVRLSVRMGGLMWWTLKKRKAGQTWRSLVPYTLDELMLHLERQFAPGMSWENFGKWQVDHVLPRRMFNYASPGDADFQACWALTNLRPLWKSENCAKGGRRLHLL